MLKKSVSTSSTAKQGFQRGHPQRYAGGCEGGSRYRNSQESSRGLERTTNRSEQLFQIRSSFSKDMTRTIPCTTLFTCVKLINMCSICTCTGGNTSAWGTYKSTSCMHRWGSTPVTPETAISCMSRCDSTPATSNSQYEHENNMFIVGRETTNLHRKLVKVDPGSLGTAGSWGIPHRISGDPLPRLCTSGGTSILRYAVPDLRRGSGTLVQRGYRGNPTRSTKLHIPNFPSREKRWGLPSCYKPQEVEPQCQDRTLQDGGFTPSSISDPAEDWMVKLDLKDAYLQVPIHPGQHHLLQFQWQKKLTSLSAFHSDFQQHLRCLPSC